MRWPGRVNHRSALHIPTSAPTWSTTYAQYTAAPPSLWSQRPGDWAPLRVRFTPHPSIRHWPTYQHTKLMLLIPPQKTHTASHRIILTTLRLKSSLESCSGLNIFKNGKRERDVTRLLIKSKQQWKCSRLSHGTHCGYPETKTSVCAPRCT